MVRISALDLNNVRKAIIYRSNILENSISNAKAPVNPKKEFPFGENEKGAVMTALAEIYYDNQKKKGRDSKMASYGLGGHFNF